MDLIFSDLKFDLLGSADLNAIQELMQDLNSPGSLHWTETQLSAEIECSSSLALKNQDTLLAFVMFRNVAPDTFEIIYLAASQKYQRKGLMTMLLDETLKKMANAGQEEDAAFEVWLEVHEKNLAAIQFYEKQGFLKVGSRPKYYSDGGGAILYSFKKS